VTASTIGFFLASAIQPKHCRRGNIEEKLMPALFRIGLAVSAMALAAPIHARAQAAFDGTYIGVSGTTGQGGTVNCPPVPTPAPLTVSAGTVRSAVAGSFDVTVGADGRVVLHGKESIRYDGQIDPTGTLKVGGGTPRCTFYFVWKKR
jgi:hypothetical protein